MQEWLYDIETNGCLMIVFKFLAGKKCHGRVGTNGVVDGNLWCQKRAWLQGVFQCLWTPSKQVARQESAARQQNEDDEPSCSLSSRSILPISLNNLASSNDNTFLTAYHLKTILFLVLCKLLGMFSTLFFQLLLCTLRQLSPIGQMCRETSVIKFAVLILVLWCQLE